jgi:hypothetical protein
MGDDHEFMEFKTDMDLYRRWTFHIGGAGACYASQGM